MVRFLAKKSLVIAGAYVAARVARELLAKYEDDIIVLIEKALDSLGVNDEDFTNAYEHLEDVISLKISQEEVDKIEGILRDFSTNFSNPNRQ